MTGSYSVAATVYVRILWPKQLNYGFRSDRTRHCEEIWIITATNFTSHPPRGYVAPLGHRSGNAVVMQWNRSGNINDTAMATAVASQGPRHTTVVVNAGTAQWYLSGNAVAPQWQTQWQHSAKRSDTAVANAVTTQWQPQSQTQWHRSGKRSGTLISGSMACEPTKCCL